MGARARVAPRGERGADLRPDVEYGQAGPRSRKPGFGSTAEEISGWAHVNCFPDREPLLPPISLADLTAAAFAVQAALFAILERDIGRGGSDE